MKTSFEDFMKLYNRIKKLVRLLVGLYSLT
uniref:Uncharacterized protein n=1 Tax=Romanomermis culicivorax TaxID=13658 RepID=A0A915I1Q1_ROMCU